MARRVQRRKARCIPISISISAYRRVEGPSLYPRCGPNKDTSITLSFVPAIPSKRNALLGRRTHEIVSVPILHIICMTDGSTLPAFCSHDTTIVVLCSSTTHLRPKCMFFFIYVKEFQIVHPNVLAIFYGATSRIMDHDK